MTLKSLRYTHEKRCKGKIIDINETPVKRRTRRAPFEERSVLDVTDVGKPTSSKHIDNTDKKDILKTYTSPKDEYDIPDDDKKEICRK